ncbi:hypothetical protein BDV93DRAFT_514588 [Ceratobasidium sp. AG-I]|nr:hypothetical protein BDV93DRAFT_514588 [Ceratobasidium sp. AG-I]
MITDAKRRGQCECGSKAGWGGIVAGCCAVGHEKKLIAATRTTLTCWGQLCTSQRAGHRGWLTLVGKHKRGPGHCSECRVQGGQVWEYERRHGWLGGGEREGRGIGEGCDVGGGEVVECEWGGVLTWQGGRVWLLVARANTKKKLVSSYHATMSSPQQRPPKLDHPQHYQPQRPTPQVRPPRLCTTHPPRRGPAPNLVFMNLARLAQKDMLPLPKHGTLAHPSWSARHTLLTPFPNTRPPRTRIIRHDIWTSSLALAPQP